jgi:MFS transporter, DHA1 family, multidrug resistance protein
MLSTESPAATRRRPGLPVLIAMAAFGPAALNIFLPSMPGLQAAMGIDNATAQLTLTVYLAALAIGQLIVGPLSDRFGRRPVALAGIALFTIASFYCAVADTITELLIGRVFQAAGGSTGMALARAVVRDIHTRDRAASVIGYVTTAMVTVPMLAPVFGAYLDQIAGWRAGFYFITGLGLLSFAIVWTRLYETNLNCAPNMNLGTIVGNTRRLLAEPAFLGYALNSASGAGVFFAFLAGAPFVMAQTYGFPPSAFGIYFISVSFGYMFGNFCSGRFAEKAGANRMIVVGTLLMLASLAFLVVMNMTSIAHPLVIFIPVFFVAISNGVNTPSAVASAISIHPDIAGSAAGIVGFLQFGIGMLATWLVGIVYGDTRIAMVMVMVAAGLGALIAMMVALRTSRDLKFD